jgi:hypothetical protein
VVIEYHVLGYDAEDGGDMFFRNVGLNKSREFFIFKLRFAITVNQAFNVIYGNRKLSLKIKKCSQFVWIVQLLLIFWKRNAVYFQNYFK